MTCHTAVYKLLLLTLVCTLIPGLLAYRSRGSKRLNCSVYVFAPKCRGIAAKRASQMRANIDDIIPRSSSLDDTILRSVLARTHPNRNLFPEDSLKQILFQQRRMDKNQRRSLQDRLTDESEDTLTP